MTNYDSTTTGRINVGFATTKEYCEAAECLEEHQDRLHSAANVAFEKIEAEKPLDGLTCQRSIKYSISGYSHVCGKPAKGFLKNGEPVCGIHLNAERKREQGDRKWAIEHTQRNNFKKEVESAQVDFIISVHDTKQRRVIVDFDRLQSWLEDLSEKP